MVEPPAEDADWVRRVAEAARRAAADLAGATGERGVVGTQLAALAGDLEQRAAQNQRDPAILVEMDERAERVGRNEALFRNVNERLKEIGTSFSFVTETADFVCECGVVSCAEPIVMSLADYERIRADPTLFATVRGHETPDLETVIETREDWQIVKKPPGKPAELAIAEDPRS